MRRSFDGLAKATTEVLNRTLRAELVRVLQPFIQSSEDLMVVAVQIANYLHKYIFHYQ